MRCESCRREAPEGVFCTYCGADQDSAGAPIDWRHRRDRYAPHPDEHVAQPGVLTTLFPHLDHDEINEFRWALAAGLAILVALYVAGLITAALLVAAFLVPVLYLMYLYEIRVYRDAPATVLGFTIGAGIVLGVVVTLIANAIRDPLPAIDSSIFGLRIDVAALMIAGVLIPVVQEVVKPLPALILRRRKEFSETIDGLVFGVAAGLGFALAQTVVQFSQVFTTLDVRTESANWLFPLLTAAILLPLLHGSSTGMITAALWRFATHHRGPLEVGAIGVAIGGHIAFILGTQLILAAGYGLILAFAWQAVVVGGLLIYIRYLIHGALLDEASSFGLSRTVCPNCHKQVTAAAFCPSCGMALSAVPGAIRDARESVSEAATEASS